LWTPHTQGLWGGTGSPPVRSRGEASVWDPPEAGGLLRDKNRENAY